MNIMNSFATVFSTGMAVVVLSGCNATKALDATQSVPGKMDQTNEKMDTMVNKMDATNKGMKESNANMGTMIGEVKKTNSNMDTMVGEVKKTNGGMETMVDEVKKTNGNMDTMVDEVKKTNSNMDTMISEVNKTNEGMAKTNLGIHRQTLQVSLADMLKEDNTRFLGPPLAMMPGAQIFALEATPAELMQLVYVFLSFVEKTPQTDKDGENPDSFNHAKLVRLSAASVLAGLAPQATVDEIVKSQIIQGGAYQQAAVAMLMLRFQFIQQWIVKPKLEGTKFEQGKPVSKLTTPGMIAEVVQYAEALSAITDLPFASQIGIQITGLIGDDMSKEPDSDGKRKSLNERYSEKLNPKYVNSDWKDLGKAIQALDPKYTDPKSDSAQFVSALQDKILAHLPPAGSGGDQVPVAPAGPAPGAPAPDATTTPSQANPATPATKEPAKS